MPSSLLVCSVAHRLGFSDPVRPAGQKFAPGPVRGEKVGKLKTFLNAARASTDSLPSLDSFYMYM